MPFNLWMMVMVLLPTPFMVLSMCLEKSALGGVLAPFSIAKMLIARAWSKIWNLLTLKGEAASDAAFIAKKLLRSTGKVAWITDTTFLFLVVPLIVKMDREQQLNDLELQQASFLGTPTPK
ncbi:Mitochondrial import receptor subunit TOM22 like 2 [Glycine soja]|uniref:Mitochondrial import receptor subunit TOM22 like 2 n=1 Tax=Glycine soja TaxID=3848 RepID=A0A0B2QXB6_GLYSO|nr:Mitochondrial import receptor subunit TOM22 like 2 [Glycine soja]